MNRSEAKALASELGISKEDVRQLGHLSRTQTWLDAIAVHQAALLEKSEPLEWFVAESPEWTGDVDGEGAGVEVWESCLALPLATATAITGFESCAAGLGVEEAPGIYSDPWLDEGAGLAEEVPVSAAAPSHAAVYPFLVLFCCALVAVPTVARNGVSLGIGSESFSSANRCQCHFAPARQGRERDREWVIGPASCAVLE